MNIDELIALIVGGSVFITIAATIITVLCTVTPFVAVGWYIFRQSKRAKAVEERSQGWATTAGVVLKSRVEVSGGEYTSVSPHVLYEYGVGGQSYQSDKIRPGDGIMRVHSAGNAYEIVDKYPVGSAVIVYYNPANPAESALER